MQLLIDDLWKEILRCCRIAKTRAAALAYVTDLSIDFRKGDMLVVDASDPAIKSGATSAAVLAELMGRGVELYSYPFLHAKVWVFDSAAIVGSANASDRSHARLVEAGILTDDPAIVSGARAFIETLRRKGMALNATEIRRLLKLPVARQPNPVGKAKPLGVKFGKSTWITSGGEIETSLATTQQQATGRRSAREVAASAKSKIERMEFEAEAYLCNRLRRGDRVIWVWTDSKSGKPIEVEKPVNIIFDQKVRGGRLLWYEQQHADEKDVLTWKQFCKLAKHCRITNLARERKLTGHELKKLDANWPDFIR